MTAPYGLLNFDQPSAITSLLQQMSQPPSSPMMTPAEPPPPPSMPRITAPVMAPPQAERPHMLHRIAGLLGSLGGAGVGAVKSIGELGTPGGYEGILSPQEMEQAKPNRLHNIITALQGNSPSDVYQGRLNNIADMHEKARGLTEQKRLDGVRANMASMFTPKPGASQDDVRDMNEQMFSYAIRNRDFATAKLLETSNVEAMKRQHAMPVLHEVEGKGWWDMTDPKNPHPVVMSDPNSKNKQIVNAQEGIFEMKADGLYDAATGQKYTGKTVHPVSLAPSYTPITLGGGDGQPAVVKAFDTKSGTAGATIGEAKPAVTRVENAMQTAAKARLEAAVSEMNNAHNGMAEFEQKLKSGKISINGLSQFAGATANSFTHDDPASRLVQSAALSTLNRVNPELARYIRRGLSFAEGESMVSQRPSDFRTKMAAFLSTAASGASPEMIADIESRRTSILNPLNATVKSSSAPSVSPLRAKYDAAAAHLKAQGKTPEQIKAIIHEPPP